jgi:stage V sporulation protein B
MPKIKTGRKLLKAVAIVTIFSVVTRSLSFVFKIYFSRALGPEIMGLYQVCLSVFYLFAALTASGLVTVLSRRVTESKTLDPNDKGHSILTSALIAGFLSSVLVIVTIYIFRGQIDFMFPDVRAIPMFMIMLPALLTTSIYGLIRGWFWGNKDFLTFSITEAIEEILRVIFSVLFVSGIISGISGAHGIALAFAISDAAVAIILVIVFFIKGGRLSRPALFKPLLKPAVPLTAMRIFSGLMGTAIALMLPAGLIRGGYSLSDATASFGRIAGMANPLLFAPNAIVSSLAIVLIPEMSESGIKKFDKTLARHIDTGISFAILISAAFLTIFASIGSDMTVIIFDDIPSGEYLKVASWLLLIMPVHQISASALNSIGMETESFISYLISSVFMILAIHFLTPSIHIFSIIVANFITLLVGSIGNMFFLNKRLKLEFGFLKPLAMVAIIAIPSIFVGKSVRNLLYNVSPIFAVSVSAIVSLSTYFILVMAFGLLNIGGFLKIKGLNFKRAMHPTRSAIKS